MQTLLNLGQAFSSAYLHKYVIYVLHGAKDVTALMCAIAPLRVRSGVSVLFFFSCICLLFRYFQFSPLACELCRRWHLCVYFSRCCRRSRSLWLHRPDNLVPLACGFSRTKKKKKKQTKQPWRLDRARFLHFSLRRLTFVFSSAFGDRFREIYVCTESFQSWNSILATPTYADANAFHVCVPLRARAWRRDHCLCVCAGRNGNQIYVVL